MSTSQTRRSTEQSQALFARAQRHLAGGVGSGTRSPRSGWHPAPIYVAEALGSRVRDVDGNEYIDYQMGQGPLILGHRPPGVLAAVTETINERGSLFANAHDLEGRAADALAARVPSMELLRFGQSGTECVMYALRFARTHTGRPLILRFEGQYHGWSDLIHWSAHPPLADAGPVEAPVLKPDTAGIVPQLADSLLVIPFNDAAALDRVFAEHGERIAGVILEPIMGNAGGLEPAPGFLEHLRAVTTAHGSLLIFDEVLTGLRVGPSGAQGRYGIQPDLTVLAKALAAGFPVAAVGGRAEVMEVVTQGKTMHGGTYNSTPLACAAVIAALEGTGADGFYDALLERGERLAEGLVGIAEAAGVPACWTGVGSLFQVWLGAAQAPTDYRTSQALVAASPFNTFFAGMLEQRIILQPPQEGLFLMSGAHTDEDVEETLAAAVRVMPSVAEAVEAGRVGPSGGVR